MIPELGIFSIILAAFICFSGVQIRLLAHDKLGIEKTNLLLRRILFLNFILCLTAYLCLTYSYVVSDFSVENVALYSHMDKPLIYKISGTWGNHEGSLIMWLLMLSIFGVVLSRMLLAMKLGNSQRTQRECEIEADSYTLYLVLCLGFLTFVIFNSNPFERLIFAPSDGQGMNPVLQDMAMTIHPPMLYAGYIAYAPVFVITTSLMRQFNMHGEIDYAVLEVIRKSSIIAWVILTVGIALGAWWAYRELGWGGFWFWDPIENASLMPWLSGTALVHSLAGSGRWNKLSDSTLKWIMGLALLTFLMAMFGTFLARSGLINSVHAFASDPDRGIYIITFIAVLGVYPMWILSASMARFNNSPAITNSQFSLKRKAVTINNFLLMVVLLIVFVGTSYGLFASLLNVEVGSVDADFYNRLFNPVMIGGGIIASLMPFLFFARVSSEKRLIVVWGCVSIGLALVCRFLWGGGVIASFGLVSGGLLIITSLIWLIKIFVDKYSASSKNPYPMLLGHLGLGLLIFSISFGAIFEVSGKIALKEGEQKKVGDFSILYESTEQGQKADYLFYRPVLVISNGDHQRILTPERRHYNAQQLQTSEVDIAYGILADEYVVAGKLESDGTISIEFKYIPIISLVWLGCALMALAGCASLIKFNRKV
jgi:cytochrome c-type biogenesis protein CcmF